MPGVWSLLVAAPVLALALLTVAARPRGGTVAPLRLAVVRAAVAVGAFAVLTVEAAGAAGGLTAPVFGLAWLAFLLVAAALAALRARRDGWPPAAGRWRRVPATAPGNRRTGGGHRRTAREHWHTVGEHWRNAGWGERLPAAALAALVLVELMVALLAEPNNYDSQTYHLPKIEHWVAQRDVAFWPTAIHRQVTIPPGAEYLLLHLRLLTGGDALYHLVQWAAGLGCLLAASRIAAQLGGGRRAQLLTAFLIGTTPMVVLQATSTQTDLVAAAWTACAATLALDGLRRRAGVGTVVALGAATGLTAITKTSGLLGVAPVLLLWGLAQLRLAAGGAARPDPQVPTGDRAPDGGADDRRTDGADDRRTDGADDRRTDGAAGVLRTAAASVVVVAVAAVLVGPFLLRVATDFGHPLGPPRLRESIPMQRHDPASVLVNALRVGHTAFDTPLEPLREVTVAGIVGFARLIGVDPQDRATTFGRTTFPEPSWHPDEDRVAFPITGVLGLIAVVLALVRPDALATGRAGAARAYAAATAAAVLLYPVMIKWQPWGNRLLLYALVLVTPLAGLWLDAVLRRRPGRNRVAALVAVVLAASALAGILAVSYGFPRRLVGAGSVFTTDDWDTRFLRRPQWAEQFRWGAEQVEASGARRVGLVQQNDNWEYPWWLLLGDREIVALQSVLPERPPADPASVDAIVCTGERRACERLVPDGWSLSWNGYVGYAAPPR